MLSNMGQRCRSQPEFTGALTLANHRAQGAFPHKLLAHCAGPSPHISPTQASPLHGAYIIPVIIPVIHQPEAGPATSRNTGATVDHGSDTATTVPRKVLSEKSIQQCCESGVYRRHHEEDVGIRHVGSYKTLAVRDMSVCVRVKEERQQSNRQHSNDFECLSQKVPLLSLVKRGQRSELSHFLTRAVAKFLTHAESKFPVTCQSRYNLRSPFLYPCSHVYEGLLSRGKEGA
ncbi:hypothetical protein DPEC_G00023980 [Dallia pectoralis]|uniref:Uncharacterized protein n=1 Tax=Dallia pectoralis TaxID=75939 RepID=A0ACC2HHK1_DALPE|nr:hypothetical protein DPEC_G00023980 [Dallia pectoralis]